MKALILSTLGILLCNSEKSLSVAAQAGVGQWASDSSSYKQKIISSYQKPAEMLTINRTSYKDNLSGLWRVAALQTGQDYPLKAEALNGFRNLGRFDFYFHFRNKVFSYEPGLPSTLTDLCGK